MTQRQLRQSLTEKWLLIDIGNTALTFQGFEQGQFSNIFSMLNGDIPKNVGKLASSGLIDSNTYLVITSVVPKLSTLVKKFFKNNPPKKILEVGKNLPVKFSHKYNNINSLGNDRKVNIFGAIELYGGPCVVMDFGSAITADYISVDNKFYGGFIIPGPKTALSALLENTALLPKTSTIPKKMRGFLGQSTSDCIQNGILMGYASMADGLAAQFRRRYGKSIRFIATGGYAETIAPLTTSFDRIDPGHTLRSLALLALSHTAH